MGPVETEPNQDNTRDWVRGSNDWQDIGNFTKVQVRYLRQFRAAIDEAIGLYEFWWWVYTDGYLCGSQ